MPSITPYTGANPSALANALLAQNSGIQIVANSVILNASSTAAVGLYDGSLSPLGIGAGILLTTGAMPGIVNTDTGFGQSNNAAGSALIDQVINPVFNTQSFDATTLSFSFNVTDPTATSVSFNIVFGSDEYPEWVDAFVDAGVVFVNGVNYALFNHDPMHPLSVVSQNLQAGYFQDNAGGTLPIEYDGVSKVLTIVAPIVQGSVNTITIGVADCGDHILDSGLFLSGLTAGALPGSGVVIGDSDSSTTGNDTAIGSDLSDLFTMNSGDDLVYAGGGDDICAGDAGNDSLFGGSGNDALNGGEGNDDLDGGLGDDVAEYAGAHSDYSVTYDVTTGSYTLTSLSPGLVSEGVDSLTGIETVKFSDGAFYLTASGLSQVAPVAPATNAAGSAVITGIAAVGNNLSAAVSDADGLPPLWAMAFAWEYSIDNGSTWTDSGVTGATYTVLPADAGALFRVVVQYTDGALVAETVISQPKLVPPAAANTLTVDLLQLDAPLGATTMNPLTTLVQRAIELGLSPNVAEASIKQALGIDPGVKLTSFDAYAALLANPSDALALQVEAISVQVAVLTSLSNDDTGSTLALALIQAAAAGVVIDLANVDQLAVLIGVAAEVDPVTGKYPQPLNEILDRNVALFEATDVLDIEKEWQDLLSIQDMIASTSISDLSVHINQAPTGFPVGALSGMQDQTVEIAAADLLAGLSDPEGDALSVMSVTTDQPGTTVQNPDGSWSYTAAPGYFGPVEFTYWVVDPMGASIMVSKLLIIEAAATPVNLAPVVSGPVWVAVAEDAVTAINPLTNASDADGDPLSVVLPATLTDGFAYNAATGQMTFDATVGAYQHLTDGETLVVSQAYTVTDGAESSTASIEVTITGANDAAIIAGQAMGSVTEDTTLQTSGILTVTDVDAGEAAFVAGTFTGTYGTATLTAAGNWTYTLDNASAAVQAQAGGTAIQDTVLVTSLDGSAASLVITINGMDEPAQAGVLLTGTSAANTLAGESGDDTLLGLGGKDTLVGNDGDDTLDGGFGNDQMFGGIGNDVYYVDSRSDGATELAGEGYDVVWSSNTFTAAPGSEIEKLIAFGSGNVALTGNGRAMEIVGNSGINTLDDGGGAATLSGGAGVDIYLVHNAGTQVVELAGEGYDTVKTDLATYSLAANVEVLVRSGATDFHGTGNALANAIMGGAGADILNGAGGADVLTGGAGTDTFVFDNLTSGIDWITDFQPGQDLIGLDATGFGLSSMADVVLVAGAASVAVGQAALHYYANGAITFDANGGSANDAITFAGLQGHPALSIADFLLV